MTDPRVLSSERLAEIQARNTLRRNIRTGVVVDTVMNTEVADLLQHIAGMTEVLRRVEWSGEDSGMYNDEAVTHYCVVCDGNEPNHGIGCALAALLGAGPAT